MNKNIEDITMFDVLDALKELCVTRKNKRAKVYFSGELDSNRTTFEEKSNQLEIGVAAYDDFVGLIMLRLLRYAVDFNDDLFLSDKEDSQEEKLTNDFESLLEYLSKCEKQYQTSFYISDIYTRELSGYDGSKYKKTIIKKNIFDVDVWTLKRLESSLHDIFD